jgi:hypothetical protein
MSELSQKAFLANFNAYLFNHVDEGKHKYLPIYHGYLAFYGSSYLLTLPVNIITVFIIFLIPLFVELVGGEFFSNAPPLTTHFCIIRQFLINNTPTQNTTLIN